MKTAIQFMIVAWFAVASLFVLIGGIDLVWSSFHAEPVAVPAPPKPPDCKVDCANPKSVEDIQKAYAAQSDAYAKYCAALKAKADAERSPAQEAFKSVAKDIFQPLLTTMLTALLAYVFAQGAGLLINNHMRLRNNQAPEPFKL